MQATLPLAISGFRDEPASPATRATLHEEPSSRTLMEADARAQRRPRSWRQVHEGVVDTSRWLDVQRRRVGEFVITAGALEAQDGDFVAAVEVQRIGASERAEPIFGSEGVSGGHRFARVAMALRHALDVGHQVVRLQQSRGG